MPYLTQDELESRVGGHDNLVQLTDDDEDEVPDASVIALFLAGLDAELDFYFRAGGYTVPLSSGTFGGLKRSALDIANYRLKTRGDRQASEGDRQLYDDAIKFFQAVAGRKVLLEVVSAISTAYPVLESDAPLFTRESLATF